MHIGHQIRSRGIRGRQNWWKNTSTLTIGAALNNVTSTADATTDPYGGARATRIQENGVNSAHYVANNGTGVFSTVPGSTCTLSIHAKASERDWIWMLLAGTASAYFDLTNGVFGTEANLLFRTKLNCGNGWWRIAIGFRPSTVNANHRIYLSTGDGVNSYAGDNASGLYMYGPQVNEGLRLDPYVYTEGTTVGAGPVG